MKEEWDVGGKGEGGKEGDRGRGALIYTRKSGDDVHVSQWS